MSESSVRLSGSSCTLCESIASPVHLTFFDRNSHFLLHSAHIISTRSSFVVSRIFHSYFFFVSLKNPSMYSSRRHSLPRFAILASFCFLHVARGYDCICRAYSLWLCSLIIIDDFPFNSFMYTYPTQKWRNVFARDSKLKNLRRLLWIQVRHLPVRFDGLFTSRVASADLSLHSWYIGMDSYKIRLHVYMETIFFSIHYPWDTYLIMSVEWQNR